MVRPISRLKKGFRPYKSCAQLVVVEFDTKRSSSDFILGTISSICVSIMIGRRIERKVDADIAVLPVTICKCHHHFKAWLRSSMPRRSCYMPSSAAAERVFSLLNNFSSVNSGHTFSPMPFTSLSLSLFVHEQTFHLNSCFY